MGIEKPKLEDMPDTGGMLKDMRRRREVQKKYGPEMTEVKMKDLTKEEDQEEQEEREAA